MLIVLTDVLTCPRCGPDFGLVVLADRLENRRVIEGRLGCANCRESYEIRSGVADLSFPHSTVSLPSQPDPLDTDEATKIAALLGLADARGLVVLVGSMAPHAGSLVQLVPDVMAAAVGAEVLSMGEQTGVSRLLATGRLPFRDRSASGIALGGTVAGELLQEAIRVCRPGARVLVAGIPGAAARIRESGFSVLLEQDNIVVATGPPAR